MKLPERVHTTGPFEFHFLASPSYLPSFLFLLAVLCRLLRDWTIVATTGFAKKGEGKRSRNFYCHPPTLLYIHTHERTNAKPLLTFPLCRAKQNTETRREIKVGEAFCVLSRSSFPPSVLFFFFLPLFTFSELPPYECERLMEGGKRRGEKKKERLNGIRNGGD